MKKKEEKRIGRPAKPAAKGTRVSLGLKVRHEVKEKIDQSAQESGRTQSQEAEVLIERAIAYDAMLEAMKTDDESYERGFKAGYEVAFTSKPQAVWTTGDPIPVGLVSVELLLIERATVNQLREDNSKLRALIDILRKV